VKNSYYKGILLAFLASIASAAFMIPWKLAALEGSAADMVLILCFGAALVSTATLAGQGGFRAVISRPSRLEFWLSILFAILTILGNQASAQAIYYLAPAVVTSIMRLEVVFITFFAWYFLTERVNSAFWVGLAFVALGFYTMQPTFEWQGDWWQGAFYATAAALIFAIMAVITRAAIHSINPIRINSLRLWLAVILWFPMQQKLPAFDQWSLSFVSLVLCAAILGPGLGRLAFMYSSRYVEARVSAMVISSSPALAVLLAWGLIDNLPTQLELLGGTFILVGTGLSLIKFPQKPIAPASLQDHRI